MSVSSDLIHCIGPQIKEERGNGGGVGRESAHLYKFTPISEKSGLISFYCLRWWGGVKFSHSYVL